jgi:predicted anti-sigma-YlaC factor YlaD
MPWHPILRRRRRRVLACRELVDVVADYLDGALTTSELADFDAHLENCEPCRAYLDQLRQTTRLIGRVPGEPLPADLERSLLEVFRDWKSA